MRGQNNNAYASNRCDMGVNPDQLTELFQPEENGHDSVELCGNRIALFFSDLGWSLIYLSIFHENNMVEPHHIHIDVPDHILDMCVEFKPKGGCPLAREALKSVQPFDVLEHDYSAYEDALSRRYLSAFGSLGFKKIITVPVQFGEGVTIVVFGRNDSGEEAVSEDLVTVISYQLMVKFAGRFPEIAAHFTTKKLTAREAHILSLTACGLVETEIAEELSISPYTVRTHIQNVKYKLDAKNKAHAVALAIEAHEISEPSLSTAS